MSRPGGSKNKPKNILEINNEMSDEDLFLAELIRAKASWGIRAKEAEKQGQNNDRLKEYAEAYKLLINQFTIIDKPTS